MPHVERIRGQTDVYSSVSPLRLFPWYEPGTKSCLIQLWNNGCDFERGLMYDCVTRRPLFVMSCQAHEWDIYKVVSHRIKDDAVLTRGRQEAGQSWWWGRKKWLLVKLTLLPCPLLNFNNSMEVAYINLSRIIEFETIQTNPFQKERIKGNKGRLIWVQTVTLISSFLQHWLQSTVEQIYKSMKQSIRLNKKHKRIRLVIFYITLTMTWSF